MIATCPHCGDELDIPEQFASHTIRCGVCQTQFSPYNPGASASVDSNEQRFTPSREPGLFSSDHSDRYPNGRVWFLGFLSILVFGGCASGCVLAVFQLYFPTFEPITHAAGQFTVALPDPPHDLSQVWDRTISAAGLEARREFTQERYFALYADLPAQELRTDTEMILPRVAAWVADQSPGRREIRREFTFHDGYEAFDIHYAFANIQDGLILRVIRAGKRVYVVGIDGPVAPNDPRAQEFFLRFRINLPHE